MWAEEDVTEANGLLREIHATVSVNSSRLAAIDSRLERINSTIEALSANDLKREGALLMVRWIGGALALGAGITVPLLAYLVERGG